MTPVFTYYMLYQSSPADDGRAADGIAANLTNTATMTAYYADLTLFFQKAAACPGGTTVLHVEPDVWAYIQQRATTTTPERSGERGGDRHRRAGRAA